MSNVDIGKYVAELAQLIASHDQYKSDLSFRLEGLCQAVELLAKDNFLLQSDRDLLARSIITACTNFKQTVPVGLGKDAPVWPVNRFALAALAALKVSKPQQNAA